MPYVQTRLGRWFYEERGTPRGADDAAMILWPSLLFDGGMWRFQTDALARLGRVVTFDGPGHGKSEVPPPFSLEDNADALADALGHLGVRDAIVIGLSWGGMVGMRLALQHPGLVRALALFDSSAEAEDPLRVLKYRAFVAFGRRLGLPPLLIRREIVPLMFSARVRTTRPEVVERFVRIAGGFSREGLARASTAVLIDRRDILGRLGAIRAPTLVACGSEDRATHPVHSERVATRIHGARLFRIEGAGHVSALEQPSAVNDLLLPFVREHLASQAPP